jgi:hypothetical protein
MIAYVVACWFGDRRIEDSYYRADRAHFINWHIKKISELRTSVIESVIFVLNDKNFGVNIPETIGGIPTHILRRENIGMSYGAWDFAYQTFRDSYDAYFFIEDDYVPTLDNFDSIFLNKVDDNVGFVCSLYDRGHAAISNGLMSTAALNAVGRVPHPNSSNYGAAEQAGQVAMSKSVEAAGFKVAHVADDFSVPFLSPPNNMIYYGNPDGPIIIAPVSLEREKNG